MSARIAANKVRLRRSYEPPAAGDGTRILIDSLWPRGVSKENIAFDQWMKDIAPSTEPRLPFAHDPARRTGFRQRYAEEVAAEFFGVAIQGGPVCADLLSQPEVP